MKTLRDTHLDFRLWLQSEYTSRCRKNPKYSLRAFANLIQLDSSTVSQILSGKRRASIAMIERICDVLAPTPTQRNALLNSKFSKETGYYQLSVDAFAVISDWYHYAILELTFTQGFQNDAAWIARSLGITTNEAKVAVERLLRLELIEDKNGLLKKTDAFLTNYSEGLTASALKELQKQILTKALDAVDNVPQEEKDITSMTMAINMKRLPEAKKLITKFRRDMCEYLEYGKREKVYHLGIQLYPVSKTIKNKE